MNKKFISRLLMATLLHFFLLTFFGRFFLLPDNDLRIAAFLPTFLGVIWGFPGAAGIGLGNFLADLTDPSFLAEHLPLYILGSGGNFLMSYMSFKLWHIIGIDEKHSPFVLNMWNILRYIAICCLAGAVQSLYISFIVNPYLLHNLSLTDYVEGLFIKYVDVSAVIGTPLIVIMLGRQYDFARPTNRYMWRSMEGWRLDMAFSLILGVAVLFELVLPAEVFLDIGEARCVYLLSFYIWLFRVLPKSAPTHEVVRHSIYCWIVQACCAAVLFILVLLFLYTGVVTGRSFVAFSDWDWFYSSAFYTVHGIFFMLLLSLFAVEKHIIKPLNELTEGAEQFIESNPENQEERRESWFHGTQAEDEMDFLAQTMNRMVQQIYQYIDNLKQTLTEKARTQVELDTAKNIQMSLLPKKELINDRFPSLALSCIMDPAKEVGGDFYDFTVRNPEHIVLTIADVSGKGIPAAMFMTVSRTLLHNKAAVADLDIARLAAETNDMLCENNDASMFTTAFIADYDLKNHRMTYINAGHTSPLILHEDGTTEFLKKRSGPVLASMEDISYKPYTCELRPHDLFITYTDGVTEALNEQGEFMEKSGLLEAVERLSEVSEKENAAKQLHAAVKNFAGNAPQADDITLLCLYIR